MKCRSWSPLAGAAAWLFAAGCAAEQGADDPSASVPDVAAAVAPGISADLQAGRSRDALVVLAEAPVQARLAALRASMPTQGHAADRRGVALALDEVKASAVRAVSGHVQELRRFPNLPVMHVRIDSPETLAALRRDPAVAAVAEDLPMRAFDTPAADQANLTLVGQPTAASSGDLGAGSTVAVLDTGLDYTRAPFSCTAPGSPAACPVLAAQDLATDDGALDTGDLHGTNVAGIVLAVAPSAKLIALDVFDGEWAYTSTILSAIDWCMQHQATYHIVAINLSLGGGLAKAPCTLDPLAIAIAAARAAGMLTAVAAGNDAASTGLAIPACAPTAVSVGAVYTSSVGKMMTSLCTDATTAADQVGCFSNSASFLTLLAPGVAIAAAGLVMSGTSQATPHVAGAMALLAAAQPDATPDTIVQALTTSSTMVTDPRNQVVKPRLDLPSALGLTATSLPKGTVAIDGGAAYTNSATVSISVPTSAGLATAVCLSTRPTCTDWQPFATPVSFTLPGGDGPKTVYVTWKNASGATSASPASASIVLDTTAPGDGTASAKLAADLTAIAWTGFKDATSGIAAYRLVSAVGAAPADCAHGKLLYAGLATAFKGKASAPDTRYRVCAVDKAGNTSPGTLASFRTVTK